jgi:MFS family permease
MPENQRQFIAASFIAYFLLAFPFNIHGSNAPVTMNYYGITAAQQGFVVTMQSIGVIATALFIALRGERYNKIHIVTLGLVIQCVICAAVGFVPVYMILVFLVLVKGSNALFFSG